MPKRKAKKDLSSKQISLRIKEKEYLDIKKHSKQEGITQKELIMKSIKYYTGEERKEKRKQINRAACACEVQALINYLKRHHQNDSYIEEVGKRLWNLVN